MFLFDIKFKDPHVFNYLIMTQMHRVVLLNNYHRKKLNHELAVLPYKEFCKIIVDLKPSMSAYMKFTLLPDHTELVDAEEELSMNTKTDFYR